MGEIMKDVLDYYYRMIIDDDDIDDKGYFSYNNHLFCLKKYLRNQSDAKALSFLNNYMLNNNMKMNRIVLNIYNEEVTVYDNDQYLLLKIDYQDFIENKSSFYKAPLDNQVNLIKRNNWNYLWSQKIDYVEYQIEHLLHKYPLLCESVNYYIGLGENAITYFNMLSLEKMELYINHRRINNEVMYDPSELIIDYKVRDISEYLKLLFFQKRLKVETIIKYLQTLKLENIDYVLLYVRMLFPTYYFDMYDAIINNNVLEEEINNIINLNDEYEYLLYNIYIFIKSKVNILGIDWLNKKY